MLGLIAKNYVVFFYTYSAEICSANCVGVKVNDLGGGGAGRVAYIHRQCFEIDRFSLR